jgi:GNAT superfamily N-acetyltransferase
MLDESRFRDFDYDENKLVKLFASPRCLVMLKIVDDQAVGFFVGVVQQHWFGNDLAGYDLAMYLEPEHRGGMTAVRFIKRFEDWCRDQGVKTINLGSSAEIATDTARKLYTGLGYKECGFLSHREI